MKILTATEDEVAFFLNNSTILQHNSALRVIVKLLRIIHSSPESKYLTFAILKDDQELCNMMTKIEESFTRDLEIRNALAKLTEHEKEILGII